MSYWDMYNTNQLEELLRNSSMNGYTSGMSRDAIIDELTQLGVGPSRKFNNQSSNTAGGKGAYGFKSRAGGAAKPGAGAGATGSAGPRVKIFSDNLGSKFGAGVENLLTPEFDYNLDSGIQGWGQNLGGYANIANAAAHGINAIQGLGNLSDTKTETDDLSADIVTAAMNNPMVKYDLTTDQQELLSQLKRGTYDSNVGLDDINVLGALGDVGMGVLTGAAGGIPGMIIGGVGGLVNSGIGDLTNAQSRKNAELQALYAALQESNRNYGEMRRQRYMSRF